MPEGLKTILCRESPKTELSCGEAQKAALARALYRDSPVIVQDEPTAAPDPIAEEQVHSGFSGTEGDRTGKYAELWNAQAQYYAGSSGEGN